MEDYEKFVQHLVPSLRINETDKIRKLSAASSVIRFYGQPILPPLLSGARREEMQQHRDAALNAAANRKLKFESKMAHVQNILASVQVRRTPTLEEVLRESETPGNVTFPHKGSDGSALHSRCFSRSKDDLLLPSSPCSSQNNGASVCPLTSTAYSAFHSSEVTPQQNNCNRCLTSQQESQPMFISGVSHHQSASSGYLTCEDVGNTTSVSARKENLAFGSSEDACDLRSGFFLLSTSNTIVKMPDIISHPPIDGEELEKSALEPPCCRDFLKVKDIICCSQQQDSITCERRQDRSTQGGDYLSVSELIDLDKDNSLDVNSVLSDSPELSHTQSVCQHLSAESSIQHELLEPEYGHAGEGEPSALPHRLSLQALLRRSQECRRRQRMLRNQAKNAKIQERTQAEARMKTEEPSLSDKENDEVLPKSGETSGGKRPKENRGTEKTLPKAPRDIQRKIAPKFFWEKTNLNSESTHSERDESSNGTVETTFERSPVSVPLDLDTKVTSASTQKKSLLPAYSPVQRALHLINSPTGFYRGGKYNTIPVPSVSRSPVCFRSTFPAETTCMQVTFINSDHKAGVVDVEHVAPPSVQRVLATSSLHIDQLEFNLSGLRAMISDLESTLAENLGRQNQSEFVFEGSGKEVDPLGRQPVEIQADYQQDEAGGRPGTGCSSSSISESFMEEDRRVSLGDTSAASGVNDTYGKLSAEAVDVSELRLVKNIATQRAKERATHNINNKGRTDTGNRGQQPTARSVLRATQRLQIPQVLRVFPSEGGGACRLFPTLSDGPDPPAEDRGESMARGCVGLNRSYEVESPSDLWLHEASAGACYGLESSMTPQSGSEGQGGASKVKRRLLMHVTEDSTEGSDGKVNSSCSDGAAQRQGAPGRRDKQETLMQADAARIRALRAEHRRQQEELLQALAARYRLLQSFTSPSSVSASRLGDTLTSAAVAQASPKLPERYRPLLLAAVKGYLTRRLLRSERVAQLVRTVRDTQQLLQTLNPGNRQDVLLQERVALQLRAARYEVSDIFFGLSTSERMQLIGWDREAAREKELRRQSGQPRRNSSLSAATQKSLERRKERTLQRKAAGRHRGAVARSDRAAGSSAQQPQQTKGGRLKTDPQRVPKSTYSSRPR